MQSANQSEVGHFLLKGRDCICRFGLVLQTGMYSPAGFNLCDERVSVFGPKRGNFHLRTAEEGKGQLP